METEGVILSRLISRLRIAEDTSYSIGHLLKADGDELTGQGFLGVGEMFRMTIINVTNNATKDLRRKAGYK